MNHVDNLLKIDFQSLNMEEQVEIKRLGPHQPRNFECFQADKAQTRSFSSLWFDKVEWLTVSVETKMFFCFYCLLFGGSDTPWSKTGYKDLKHLSERMKKHESSIVHINNAVRVKTLGIHTIPSEYNIISIHGHNEMVRKNRHVLNRIINCIKFCSGHELELHGDDEQKSSISGEPFLDLFAYITSMDNTLDTHGVSKRTSKAILDELLDCIYHVYKEEVKRCINTSNFVSLQVDETRDVSNQAQLAMILRFITDGMLVERLVTFLELAEVTASDLGDLLNKELEFFNIGKSKLISQSYDTVALIDDLNIGIHTYMQKFYPRTKFVYCYAHDFSQIIRRICSRIKCIDTFFVNISGFATFFSCNEQMQLLRIERNKNRDVEDKWNFQCRIINNIYENQVEIMTCLEKIQNAPGWDDVWIRESIRLTNLLNEKEFFFFLDFFYSVLQHVDLLYDSLQQDDRNSDREQLFQEFEAEMGVIRDNIEMMEDDDSDVEEEPPSKRVKKNCATELKLAANDAWDITVSYIKNVFEASEYTAAFSVIDPNRFKKLSNSFPTDHVHMLVSKNPILNRNKLSNELVALYNNETFAVATSLGDLLKLLTNSDLLLTFTHVVKLLEMVVTTPVPTNEPERCFDTLKKTRDFLKHAKRRDKLNALAVLSVHQDVIKNIPNFNKLVIDRFALEKGRTQYLYK